MWTAVPQRIYFCFHGFGEPCKKNSALRSADRMRLKLRLPAVPDLTKKGLVFWNAVGAGPGKVQKTGEIKGGLGMELDSLLVHGTKHRQNLEKGQPASGVGNSFLSDGGLSCFLVM